MENAINTLSNQLSAFNDLGELPKKKQIMHHHKNLSNKVMGVLCGRTGCGKSYLMFKILTTPNFLDYNNLIIYTTTQEQPIYQFLKHGLDLNLKKEAIWKLFQMFEENDEDVNVQLLCEHVALKHPDLIANEKDRISVLLTDDMGELSDPSRLPKGKKNCVLFDDCIMNKDQTIQKTYFTKGRHANCSCFYLTQSFYSLDGSIIRRNANIFMLFELNNRNVTELLKDLSIPDKDMFKQTCKTIWSKPFSYITINLDKPPSNRIIENIFE